MFVCKNKNCGYKSDNTKEFVSIEVNAGEAFHDDQYFDLCVQCVQDMGRAEGMVKCEKCNKMVQEVKRGLCLDCEIN